MTSQVMIVLLALLAQAPRFEIATLKRSPPPSTDAYPITLGVVRDGKLNLTNVTLSDCIRFAWDSVSDDQISGPDWIRSQAVLFDIVAQVPPNASREQLLLMTQSLLADRLRLVVHKEQKELRYLALLPGKDGPKMKQVAPDPQTRNNSGGRGRVTGNQVPMQLLAALLSRLERAIVVDDTGLPGSYQVNLNWTTDDTAAGASLFTAIQEQLGLRLEARKGPLDILVVDHADKTPAEN